MKRSGKVRNKPSFLAHPKRRKERREGNVNKLFRTNIAETWRTRGTCRFSLRKWIPMRVCLAQGVALNPGLARCAITTAHPAWDTCTRFLFFKRDTSLSRLRIADLLTGPYQNRRNFKCGIRSKDRERSLGASTLRFTSSFVIRFPFDRNSRMQKDYVTLFAENFSEISRVGCPLDTNITTVSIIIS